jgi:Flp pilus assembly protein TadD
MSLHNNFEKATALFEQGKFDEAIAVYTTCLDKTPGHLPSIYRRGLAKFKLGRYLEAIEDFNEVLTLEPTNASYLSDRAVARHLAGDNVEALKDLNTAQELEPNNAYRYSSRAYVKASMGDVEGGIEDYKKAIELDPEDAVAYNNLGLLEEKLGYTAQAKRRFEVADNLATKQNSSLADNTVVNDTKPTQTEETLQDQELISTTSAINKPLLQDYFREMKNIIATKQGRRELIDFIRRGFKGKL